MNEWMRPRMYARLLFNSLIHGQNNTLADNPLFWYSLVL